jgi:hypothetical protein
MKVEIRAKRILTPLDSYEAIDETSCSPSSLWEQMESRGAKPLGIYKNHRATAEEAILVSDVGLFLVLSDGVAFVDYRAVQRVDVTAKGTILSAETASSKSEADGVLLNGESASPIFVPVRNGDRKYRDTFEFSRFVSRAAEDAKTAWKPSCQSQEESKLARQG